MSSTAVSKTVIHGFEKHDDFINQMPVIQTKEEFCRNSSYFSLRDFAETARGVDQAGKPFFAVHVIHRRPEECAEKPCTLTIASDKEATYVFGSISGDWWDHSWPTTKHTKNYVKLILEGNHPDYKLYKKA